MKQKPIIILTLALSLCLFASCTKEERDFYSGLGKKPVYVPLSDLLDIRSEPPRDIDQSGTIYLQDTLLFLLEQGKGIHVFNIKDSVNTVNLVFFKIPAITDFVINGSLLYADSWRDLVAIDISDLQQIRETDRISNVINPALYPPFYTGIFECVDETKGAIVGWEETELENVRCFTN
ncbi:MAG: hypothetical protein R3A50_10880 [Saprospiraceae bacterium]|nr:hypothetical protein [Saprospiraceae bacterium]MCB0807460.1 hypothetical protein [Bacteroidales bacterium]